MLYHLLTAATVTASLAQGTSAACDIPSLNAGDQCMDTWANLKDSMRVTQDAVGYGWVQRTIDKYMNSKKNAQARCNEKPVPVVKGPGNLLYIIDHHHLLAGLDFSGFDSVQPTIEVTCDYSDAASMDAFWAKMTEANFVYPFGRPIGSPTSMPVKLDPSKFGKLSFTASSSSFVDDAWRGLAGWIRKTASAPGCTATDNKVYECRGYDKTCDPQGGGIPFFEFRWAYFYNAAYHDPSMWPSASQHTTFKSCFDSLPNQGTPGSYSGSAWESCSAQLFQLSRSATAGAYSVPADFSSISGRLPGHFSGLGPIKTDDPECAEPVCPGKFANRTVAKY